MQSVLEEDLHMQTSTRKFIDCREFPSETNCSLRIAGTEAEVIKAAAQHAVDSHGHKAGPDLEKDLRSALRDET
jgi:predicted small metal-binding protein